MINVVNGICMDCGHRHRGIAQCSFCDCVWEITQEKINIMIQKIIYPQTNQKHLEAIVHQLDLIMIL